MNAHLSLDSINMRNSSFAPIKEKSNCSAKRSKMTSVMIGFGRTETWVLTEMTTAIPSSSPFRLTFDLNSAPCCCALIVRT